MTNGGPLARLGELLAPRSWRTEAEVTDEKATKNADAATPGHQDADPDAPTPSAEELRAIEQQVREMIRQGRAVGWTLAADNLEDWLEGRYAGETKRLSARWFRDEEFLLQHLRTNHRPRIILGVERRLAASRSTMFPDRTVSLLCGHRSVSPEPNTLKPGGPEETGRTTIYWNDSLFAPFGTELFYALGGFTVLSTVALAARQVTEDVRTGWIIDVERWEVQICDRYDWDIGKTTVVPLHGTVRDDDLAKLERHSKAASYDVVSEPWTATDSELTGTFAVNP